MDYNHITSFLDKFKKILFEGQDNQKIAAEIIEKHILSPIDYKYIKIKNTIIYIEGSPILRSEVLIHKQGILNDLAVLLPNHKFTDLR